MEAPTKTQFKAAKRIIQYLEGTLDFRLFYSSSKEFKLEGYCDSDWAGDFDDRKSTTGFVFFFGDTAFTWNSRKQPVVTLSTCEAEYVAATSCVCHVIWLRNLLKAIGLMQEQPTEINVDNKSTIALSKNPVFHDRSKHIDTRFHFIRECISKKEIHVKYVKTEDQVADIFTKLVITFNIVFSAIDILLYFVSTFPRKMAKLMTIITFNLTFIIPPIIISSSIWP